MSCLCVAAQEAMYAGQAAPVPPGKAAPACLQPLPVHLAVQHQLHGVLPALGLTCAVYHTMTRPSGSAG